MMMQQTMAVVRGAFGRTARWLPQNRSSAGYGWRAILRFHWIEVVVGAVLAVCMATGSISFWLVPLVTSLLFAPILSRLSAIRVSDGRFGFARLEAPQTLREPRIVRRARAERAGMAELLGRKPVVPAIAAE